MLNSIGKPFSLKSDAVSRNATWISVTQGESFTLVLWCQWVLSGPGLISDGLEGSGNACCSQMNPCFSLFLGENRIKFSVPNTDNARPHSARATTECFYRHSTPQKGCACLFTAVQIYLLWKMYHEKENQAIMTTDCWATVLYQTRLSKYSTFKIPTISILPND